MATIVVDWKPKWTDWQPTAELAWHYGELWQRVYREDKTTGWKETAWRAIPILNKLDGSRTSS